MPGMRGWRPAADARRQRRRRRLIARVDRRTVRFFVLVLAAIFALAVGAALLGSRGPASVRPADAPTVDGIVVGVDSAGLGNVSGFSLRTDDGRTLKFGLSALGDAVRAARVLFGASRVAGAGCDAGLDCGSRG